MKSVVFNDTGREVEFKPNSLFAEYLKLTEKDVKAGFKDSAHAAACPACRGKKNEKVFDKFGFTYVECLSCGTVYTSLSPSDEMIKKHYLNSASGRFWREKLSKATDDKRREKVYAPRLQWILDMTQEFRPKADNIASINEKNSDFMHGFLKSPHFGTKYVINPYFETGDLTGGRIISDLNQAEKLKGTIDIALAFETLDYTSDLDALMVRIKELLADGGLIFLTTISISGFDLQVLWENSRNIFPPDRIRAVSRRGLKALFERNGFEILEYSTPGILDLDVVRNAAAENIPVPRFVKSMLEQEDEQVFRDFQDFLQISKLSSFVRILLRKKEA